MGRVNTTSMFTCSAERQPAAHEVNHNSDSFVYMYTSIISLTTLTAVLLFKKKMIILYISIENLL